MIVKTKNKLIISSLILLLVLLSIPYQGQASLVGDTSDATLSLSPNVGTYKTGNNYAVDILLNTHGQNVVAVAAYLSYNTSLFQVVSIDTSSSVFPSATQSIAESVIDATTINGKVKLTIGSPTPGVNTVSGKVATLNIKGLTDTAPSLDNFTFDFITAGSTLDSNVIKDNQIGTEILTGVDNGKYTFDGTAPANVSAFTATAGNTQVSLAWTNPGSDFSGVTILRKTGSYPTGVTDGIVVYEGSSTSYVNTGLTNGTAYYFRAFAHDVLLNYATTTGGAQATATPVPPPDTTPPAAITNLSAIALNARSITLNWTAVGNDGNVGTAASYDARYSTSAITVANFAAATQLAGEPAPKINGSVETMTVTWTEANPLILGDTTYYFAIKAIDNATPTPNTGAISNLPSAKTYRTADLNLVGSYPDKIINSVDFGILMSFWGNTTKPPADMNQDGFVNSPDFGIMMSQWGSY